MTVLMTQLATPFDFNVTPATFCLKCKNLLKCTKFCSTCKLEVAAKKFISCIGKYGGLKAAYQTLFVLYA